MKKFGIGDTVIGNSANCHGVTGEDCVLTVTYVGENTFSGIIDEHPTDDDCEGEAHDGLRYEWFDLEESVSDILDTSTIGEYSRTTKASTPSKDFADLDWVTIREGYHLNSSTKAYEGDRARVICYERFIGTSWIITVMLNNGNLIEVYEYELKSFTPPSKAATYSFDAPKDVKAWGRTREEIVIEPAHKKETMPVKEAYILTPSYEHVLNTSITRKRGHIPVRSD